MRYHTTPYIHTRYKLYNIYSLSNKKVAHFHFSQRDDVELRLVVGDELSLKLDASAARLYGSPWQDTGIYSIVYACVYCMCVVSVVYNMYECIQFELYISIQTYCNLTYTLILSLPYIY